MENPRSNQFLPLFFGLIFLLGAGGTYYLFAQDVPLPKQPVTLKADKTKEAIIQPVKEQLNFIKGGQVEKAYKLLVSQGFKEAMSLESFIEFVQQYPALKQYTSLTFSNPKQEGDKSYVIAFLHSDEGTVPVQYSLIEEGGRWKITGFILNQGDETEKVNLDDLKELFPVIQRQLSRLRDGDLKKAYQGLVSKKFQKTTPFETFKDFVKEHSILLRQTQAMAISGDRGGNQANLTVMVRDDNEEATILYNLINEEGKWKILGMKLLTPTTEEEDISERQEQNMMQTLGFFLAALHEGKEEIAYDKYTSEEFKTTTSKSVLTAFLDDHPLLKGGGKAKYIDGGIHDGVASIYISFGKEPKMAQVLFRMTEEEGKWKILGMSVQSETEIVEGGIPKSIKTKEVLDRIRHWLFLIGNNDASTLYFADTAEEFQESTSIDQFLRFVEDHPILSDSPKIELVDMTTEDQALHLTLELSTEEEEREVEFELVYREGSWKLLRMEVKAPLIKEEGGQAKAVVGTIVTPDGFIQDPTHTIDGVDQSIVLNLYLPNATKGDSVEIVLVHQETGSKSPPLNTQIEEAGNTILTYSFSPPKTGWPEGEYQFEIYIPDQETLTYSLLIKE